MEWILRTSCLSKDYKGYKAVNEVSLCAARGEIYGFLGQNGAGKTTTIRMILGLVWPTSGEVELFGERVKPGKHMHLERIGSIIEYPGFYPNLTSVENLDIHRRLMGVPERSRIDEALELAGMYEVRNKKAGSLSLGMKQRLGIARALLHRPELLILDEPTNGLDPVGIKEIRKLLLELATVKNITIFMSSHILSEVQQLASRIGILHQGRLLEEIDREGLQGKSKNHIQLRVGNDKKTAMLLEQQLGIHDYLMAEPGVIRIYERLEESASINRILVENGVEVLEIAVMKDSLEDYFIQLTGGAFHV